MVRILDIHVVDFVYVGDLDTDSKSKMADQIQNINLNDYCALLCFGRRVWRYQRGNHNPYIEEEQTIQWPKEKVQKDRQRSTKHSYKIIDRVTWTPLKSGGELRATNTMWLDICQILLLFENKFC